jgi:hypothetical protein
MVSSLRRYYLAAKADHKQQPAERENGQRKKDLTTRRRRTFSFPCDVPLANLCPGLFHVGQPNSTSRTRSFKLKVHVGSVSQYAVKKKAKTTFPLPGHPTASERIDMLKKRLVRIGFAFLLRQHQPFLAY